MEPHMGWLTVELEDRCPEVQWGIVVRAGVLGGVENWTVGVSRMLYDALSQITHIACGSDLCCNNKFLQAELPLDYWKQIVKPASLT